METSTPVPDTTEYVVMSRFEILMFGTLAECYDAYPTLATVPVGTFTRRGLIVTEV